MPGTVKFLNKYVGAVSLINNGVKFKKQEIIETEYAILIKIFLSSRFKNEDVKCRKVVGIKITPNIFESNHILH